MVACQHIYADWCCPWKWVPGIGSFTNIGNDYGGTNEHEYGCLDSCLYVKTGTEEKYCFAPGPYQVLCNEHPCGPPECGIFCKPYQECFHYPGVCEHPPCCEQWLCVGGNNQVGNITINEDGTKFNQTVEDTPNYYKMSVPAHNDRPEAVVFFDKTFGLRVTCTQGLDTAASFTWSDTTEAIRAVQANEGNVIDAATENRTYFIEYVSDDPIPDDDRPVDILPNATIYRSTINQVSRSQYEAEIEIALDVPSCYRYPYYGHVLTARVPYREINVY